jgi:hypothetical protein
MPGALACSHGGGRELEQQAEALAADTDPFTRVARRALELCHFDPETGEDLRP